MKQESPKEELPYVCAVKMGFQDIWLQGLRNILVHVIVVMLEFFFERERIQKKTAVLLSIVQNTVLPILIAFVMSNFWAQLSESSFGTVCWLL